MEKYGIDLNSEPNKCPACKAKKVNGSCQTEDCAFNEDTNK